jgi:uncharacterized membrane protein HdeD (DUF308 family)
LPFCAGLNSNAEIKHFGAMVLDVLRLAEEEKRQPMSGDQYAKENAMNVQPQPDRLNPRYEECLRLHKCWAWFVGLGIVLMVVGAMAIGAALITGLAVVLTFAILLLVGGVVQIVNGFLARSWRAFFLYLLAGILHLIVGGLMIEKPDRTLDVLTLLLAVAFFVGGVLRIIYGLMEDFSGRGWVLLNGLIAVLLGIAIWRQWPERSDWIIGLFVGIDLIFSGWSWVMLGLIVKAHASGVKGLEPKPFGTVAVGMK